MSSYSFVFFALLKSQGLLPFPLVAFYLNFPIYTCMLHIYIYIYIDVAETVLWVAYITNYIKLVSLIDIVMFGFSSFIWSICVMIITKGPKVNWQCPCVRIIVIYWYIFIMDLMFYFYIHLIYNTWIFT